MKMMLSCPGVALQQSRRDARTLTGLYSRVAYPDIWPVEITRLTTWKMAPDSPISTPGGA